MRNLENEWRILPGGGQVRIVDSNSEPMPVELTGCSSQQDFREATEVIDKEIVKPKGKLMRLADAIRNLGRPEMREEGEKRVEAQIEEAMDKETEEGRKFWK